MPNNNNNDTAKRQIQCAFCQQKKTPLGSRETNVRSAPRPFEFLRVIIGVQHLKAAFVIITVAVFVNARGRMAIRATGAGACASTAGARARAVCSPELRVGVTRRVVALTWRDVTQVAKAVVVLVLVLVVIVIIVVIIVFIDTG